MAKNYSLTGLSADIEMGKGGSRLNVSGVKIRARNAADGAFVNMQGLDATADDDLVTFRQFNNALNGLNWKEHVVAATTVAGTLATDFDNGKVIDGVTLATGERILIKDQASGIENGIYIVAASGAPARASDMPTGAAAANDAMFASEGTINADTAFVCTNDAGSDIVGTDALVFVLFSSVTAGITSIALAGAATGIDPVVNGTGPAATLTGFLGESGVLTAALSGADIVYSVDALGIGTAKIANDAVTEAKLDQGVAVLYRRLALAFGDWPVATGTNTASLGAALPTGAIVTGGLVLITTAFDNSALLQVGTSASPGAVQSQAEIDLESIDTYIASTASNQSASQLEIERETGAIAPTVGVGEVIASFINP